MKPPNGSNRILQAFASTLRLESHSITRRPNLLWQQFYNRLQWESGAVATSLRSEYVIRTAPNATPWLRSRKPVRESRELVRILGGHSDGISGVAFTPDGRRLVSTAQGIDQTIRVWDVWSGAELMRIKTSIYDGADVDVSPDAAWIVSIADGTSSDTKTLQIWDLETGAQLVSVEAVSRGQCVKCSPDGHRITVGGTGRPSESVSIDEPPLVINSINAWDISYSPDARHFVSAKRNAVLFHDVESGEVLSRWEINAMSIAYAPGGRIVAAGSFDGSLHLWSVEERQEIAQIQGHEDAVRSLAFSPDGNRIVSASDDESVRLWDIAQHSMIADFMGHDGPVVAVAYSPDGKWIASGGEDRTIRLWKPSQPRTALKSQRDHATAIGLVNFTPDGHRVVTASQDGAIGVWDTETGLLSTRLHGHDREVRQFRFLPDEERLFSESIDSWRLWDLASGKELSHGESGYLCTLSRTGRLLASCSEGGTTISISDTSSGEECSRFQQQAEVSVVKFSPDERLIASGSTDHTIRIWHAASGRLLLSLVGHTETVGSLAFSPDGCRLVSGAGKADDAARIWELGEQNLAGPIPLPTSGKSAGPDSEFSFLSGHGGASFDVHWVSQHIVSRDAWYVRVWHAGTGELLGLIRYYQTENDRHFELGFSPDGERIAVADAFRNYLWNGQTVSGGTPGGSSKGKTLKHGEQDNDIQIVYGRGDVSAIAAGPESYPYRALGRGNEIVIESCRSEEEVSWFPVNTTLIRTHPCGSIWAVTTGSQLRLLSLEGKTAR